MALDLSNPPLTHLTRPQHRTPPTVLQLCPCQDIPDAHALALCQTDDGRKIYGVDYNGGLFVLGGAQ